MLRRPQLALRSLPGASVVAIERGPTEAQREPRGRVGQVLYLEAQRDGRVVAQHADVAEVDVLREADHAAGVGMIEQEEREADAREENEERRREEQDGHREEARRREKTSPDHAPAAENPRDVDREPGPVASPLAVVPLHLAAQVAEHQGSRRNDQEPEEADAVGQPAAEHRPRHEVQEREHDDLLVVGGPAPGRQSHDLEEGRELHRDVERRAAGEEAGGVGIYG